MNRDYDPNGTVGNGNRNGSEICLDGKHLLSKLFPGTLGRELRAGGSLLHQDCPYCRAEIKTEAEIHRHYAKLLAR